MNSTARDSKLFDVPRIDLTRYEIRRRLATSLMAEVSLAWDRILRRKVVVKTLRVSPDQDVLARRLLREAGVLAALDDPRIVKIYDLGVDLSGDRPTFYLITQYLEGRTLREHLDATPPLETDESLGLARGLCDALAVVHAQGLVHRDLKPANVMLCPAAVPPDRGTGRARVVLIDFGIARPLGRRAPGYDEQTLTRPGTFVGTVAYSSPERFVDDRPDAASDLYSLGCILFEMVTGRRPFGPFDAPAQAAHAHLHTPVPSVLAFRPEAPPGLDALIRSLLAKRPEDRPARIGEVTAALDDLTGDRGAGGPNSTKPPGGDRRTHRPDPDAPLVAAQAVQRVEREFDAALGPGTPGQRMAALARVFDLAQRTLSAGHRTTWLVALHLARAQHRAGLPDRAADLLRLFNTQLANRVPVTDQLAVTIRLNLARYTGECGRPEEAARMLSGLVADIAELVRPDNESLLEARFDRAHWAFAAGDHETAIDLLADLLGDHQAMFGTEDRRTAGLRARTAAYRTPSSGGD